MLVTVVKSLILALVAGAAAGGELLVLLRELLSSHGGSLWVLGAVYGPSKIHLHVKYYLAKD